MRRRDSSRGSSDGVDYGTRGSHGDEGMDWRDELAAKSMEVTAAHLMGADIKTAAEMKNMIQKSRKPGVEM